MSRQPTFAGQEANAHYVPCMAMHTSPPVVYLTPESTRVLGPLVEWKDDMTWYFQAGETILSPLDFGPDPPYQQGKPVWIQYLRKKTWDSGPAPDPSICWQDEDEMQRDLAEMAAHPTLQDWTFTGVLADLRP